MLFSNCMENNRYPFETMCCHANNNNNNNFAQTIRMIILLLYQQLLLLFIIYTFTSTYIYANNYRIYIQITQRTGAREY